MALAAHTVGMVVKGLLADVLGLVQLLADVDKFHQSANVYVGFGVVGVRVGCHGIFMHYPSALRVELVSPWECS